jgi:hypothetical protein
MKTKLFFAILVLVFLSSCKSTTLYSGYIGQGTQTEVSLSEANFKVLGSFSGTASARRQVISVKNKSGVVSAAKMNLLANAKEKGVEMVGARALVNITTDVVENSNRVTCTMSAEIIEFIK